MVFQFTDEPRPPEPPYQSGQESIQGNRATQGLSGVAGAVFRAFGGQPSGVSTPESDALPKQTPHSVKKPADQPATADGEGADDAVPAAVDEAADDPFAEPADEADGEELFPSDSSEAPALEEADPPTPVPDDD
jgi:hypothetical protein